MNGDYVPCGVWDAFGRSVANGAMHGEFLPGVRAAYTSTQEPRRELRVPTGLTGEPAQPLSPPVSLKMLGSMRPTVAGRATSQKDQRVRLRREPPSLCSRKVGAVRNQRFASEGKRHAPAELQSGIEGRGQTAA